LDKSHKITNLLHQAYEGRGDAADEVMELVYADLCRVAGKQLRERHGGRAEDLTLEPAALVNEAFLRLIKQRKRYDNRGHFFAIATKVMLRVLMDYYRSKAAAKRGGDRVRVTLSGIAAADGPPIAEIPAFIEALKKLEGLDARTAEVVKLRVLWGLTNPEISQTSDISLRTVEREWRFARKWLAAELQMAAD
jgi:RNA polymerase sigma factor (TIGR02999 family)